MYPDRRGGQTKTTPNKTFQAKTPQTKTNLPVKTYVCMHVLLKIVVGVPRCVTYFRGVPRCVTKCDRGRGSKLVQNSVTYMYFMDGPSSFTCIPASD